MEIRRSRSASKLTNNQSNPLSKYQIAQMLGQGQYGKVYKAILKNYNNNQDLRHSIYAIKIIPICKLKKNPKLKQLLINQIDILSKLKHEYIIKFEELFVWDQKVFMVYQYCQGGSLDDIMPISQNKGVGIFGKIIMACSFAEKNNILHRDIKPANILFKDGEPRVADWGFSRYLKEQLTANSFVGSPAYMAPQLLNGSDYTNKADVWSFGVMVYQCLFNQMPWQARNIKDLLFKLRTVPLTLPKQTSPIFKLILKSCLQINPQKRTSFQHLQSLLFELKAKKLQKTQSNQNPQQHLNSELSQQDIRKCSYYLQCAKQVQKFSDQQTKILCFDLILTSLRKIKNKNILEKSQKKDKFMSPCFSQRKMSLTKRQSKIPNTTAKLSKKQLTSQCYSQTNQLLTKQINLIQKIKQSITNSNYLTISPSKSALNITQVSSQRSLIKHLIKKLIRNISMSQKSSIQSPSSKTSRRQLIEMNCILQIIMYEQFIQQVKNKRLGEKIKQMEGMGINQLMRTVNHRILYLNQLYCKRNQ